MRRLFILVIGIVSIFSFFSGCTTTDNEAVKPEGAAYNKWLGEKLFADGEYEKAFEIFCLRYHLISLNRLLSIGSHPTGL